MSPLSSRTHQARECARAGCDRRYDPRDRKTGTPQRYCSIECWRLDGVVPQRRAPVRQELRSAPAKPRRKAISEASHAQRAATRDRACVVCDQGAGACHPAHIIPRGVTSVGQDDPRAVVPLCAVHHRLYDEGGLSILEFLEPHYRVELAFAVERVGLLSTLRRVTNERQAA
jgi:hypothetical protein